MRMCSLGLLLLGAYACAELPEVETPLVEEPAGVDAGVDAGESEEALPFDGDFDGLDDAPRPRVCTRGGLCYAESRFFPSFPSSGAAVGRELYLLESNGEGYHWDGEGWLFMRTPRVYDWLHFSASPGALWGLSIMETPEGQRSFSLWRRERESGDWTQIVLPFFAHRLWAADDAHVWLHDGLQLWLYDGSTFSAPFTPGGRIVSFSGVSRSAVWMVTDDSRLWHFNGQGWTLWRDQPCDESPIREVVAHPDSPRVICLDSPRPRLLRWQDGNWSIEVERLKDGEFMPSPELGVWRETDSTLQKSDGSGFHQVPGYVGFIRRAYGSSLWHMSQQGAVAEWEGTRWVERGRTEPEILNAAVSGDVLWLSGKSGFLARREAGRWQRISLGLEEDFISMAASDSRVWASTPNAVLSRETDTHWSSLHRSWAEDPQVWMSSREPTGWIVAHSFAWRSPGGNEPTPGRLKLLSGESESDLWALTKQFALQKWDPASRSWSPHSPEIKFDYLNSKGETWGLRIGGGLVKLGPNDEWIQVPWKGADPWQLLVRGPGELLVRDSFESVWRFDGGERRLLRSGGCRMLYEGPREPECLTRHGAEPAEEGDAPVRLFSSGERLVRAQGERQELLNPRGRVWTDGREGVVLQHGRLWRHRPGELFQEAVFPHPAVELWASGEESFGLSPGDQAIVFRVRDGKVEEVWRGSGARALGGPTQGPWLAGDRGLLLRWNGTAFEKAPGIEVDPSVDFSSVSPGEGPDDLWISVSSPAGRLLHRVDGRWQWESLPSTSAITQVWAGAGRVWAQDAEWLWERTSSGWQQRSDMPFPGRLGGDPKDGSARVDGHRGLWRIAPSSR